MRSADSSAGNSSFFVTDLHDLLQGKRRTLSGPTSKGNPGVAQCLPVVDGVSGTTNIFASKFGALQLETSTLLLNIYSLLTSVQASLTVSHLSSVILSEDRCYLPTESTQV